MTHVAVIAAAPDVPYGFPLFAPVERVHGVLHLEVS